MMQMKNLVNVNNKEKIFGVNWLWPLIYVISIEVLWANLFFGLCAKLCYYYLSMSGIKIADKFMFWL